MAEVILYDIAGSLLKNLGSRAVDEIASTWGFKTRLDRLKNTVNTIKNVLLDAEERRLESHTVSGWLERLKDSLYAADDLFDEFATVASQREAMGKVHTFFSGSSRIGFAFNISKKIKQIRQELDDIVKDGSEFAFVLRPLEEGRLLKRGGNQSHSFVDVEEVIGREDDKEAVLSTLIGACAAKERRVSALSIVGIGGLGKTTLAQLVYNDERIKEHFELKLWVCVSEIFDVKQVIMKILMSATNTVSENLEMDQLQGQLRNEISGKKYFLVLDDVWNEKPEEWLNLSAILKVGGEGSMILVTTRSRKVAEIVGTLPAHVLEGLSEEKSWSLFEKMAFEPGESQKKPHLAELGKEIVKKCANVPLALRTLGSLLRGNEEWKWISIAGTSFSELRDNQNNMMAILKISYQHLLSPLKNCFTYCALFPKGYEFPKEYLVDLWVAEGFVVPAYETQSVKELGNEYLMILLQRCFFQDVRRDRLGSILSFKMHDLMHDLALAVSGTESKVAKLHDKNFSERIRRWSSDSHMTSLSKIPSFMLKTKLLRTFLLPCQLTGDSEFNTAVLQQLISSFRCLRVLDLCCIGLRSVPKTIGNLIHLRYLNLSCNPIEKLPNSITKLRNLQTLILHNCGSLRLLPILTRKLTNLRSLDVGDCRSLTYMPPGLGELTSLDKLPYFGVKSSLWPKGTRNPAIAHLRDLKTLKFLTGFLHIKLLGELKDPASEAGEANLSSKHGLTDLYIEMTCIFADVSNHDEAILECLKPHQNLKALQIRGYRGQKLPSWAMMDSLCKSLPNLIEIRLSGFINCQQVPCFSQLPFLKRLALECLTKLEYVEKSVHELESPPSPSTRMFFPCLQELVLEDMANLKGWWAETNVEVCSDEEKISYVSPSFCGVIKLQIHNCPCLALFPLAPNVEELKLEMVNKELTVLKKLTSSEGVGDFGSSGTISEYSSKLKRLSIDDVEILSSMPEECLSHLSALEIHDTKLLNTFRLEEVLKCLSSLSSLEFRRCDSLASISGGMEHLASLKRLKLYRCTAINMSEKGEIEEGMPWKALTHLHELELLGLDKLEHLPSGIQRLTNLRSLKLSFNENLKEVPDWIGCLSSLESMEVLDCPMVRRLPEEMRKLTSLNYLRIAGCRRLTERCRGPNGANWPNLRHIQRLAIMEYPL